jgi:glycosyltransferase involved in cell wall biosynthesis
MSNIKVSIITPSYNQAPFLEQCIRSVLNQDYQNIEYIIIDGGSNDGSIDIIKKYEKNLAYWESEPDNGQSHAINKGFKKATGDIVAWLNSDDLYFPDAVSIAVKRFQEQTDLVLFYGNCVFIDKNGGFIRYFTEVEPYDLNRLLNYSDYIMQPTTFFSRQKLIEIGYLDENLDYTMDWDLWCKLSKIGKVYNEKSLIAANRDYDTTKTNSGGLTRLKEISRIKNRHGTTFWPHSIIAYSAAEIRNVFSKSNNILLTKIGIFISNCFNLLSPNSLLFVFKNKEKNYLYGFKPHSTTIPKGKGEIHLPFIGLEPTIEFEFELENEHQLVYINGIPNKSPVFKLIIDSKMQERKILSFIFEFKSENGAYCKGEIKAIKMTPRIEK